MNTHNTELTTTDMQVTALDTVGLDWIAEATKRRAASLNVGHDWTMSTALDDKLVDAFVDNQTSVHTRSKYRRDLDSFTAFVASRAACLRSVGREDVAAFADSLTGAPKSRRERLATVKSFYGWCVKSGALRFNPALTVKLPSAPSAIHERILSPETADAIVNHAKSPRDRALLALLFRSGARVSEVLSLTWHDVRTESNGAVTIRFTRAKQNADAKVVNVSSQVHGQDVAAALAQLRREGQRDSDRVFTSHRAPYGALVASDAWRAVKAAAAAAGVVDDDGVVRISPHWFRHGCASNLVRKGFGVETVCKYLGHASVQTTMQYVHLNKTLDMTSAFTRL
jgi:integrase/recombinase XerD